MKNKNSHSWVYTGRSMCLVLALGLSGGALSACNFSAIGSVMTNPTKAWALNEPAPLTVVIHRQDSADATAQQVERLLLRTPTGEGSTWPGELQLTDEQVREGQHAAAGHPYYAGNQLKVMPASIWADALSRVAPEPEAAKPAPTEGETTPAETNPELVPAALPVEEATRSAAAPQPTAAGATPVASGDSATAAPDAPPSAADTAAQDGSEPADGVVADQPAGDVDPTTGAAEETVAEAPAAAPAETKPVPANQSPSLLAALSPALAQGSAEVDAKFQAIDQMLEKIRQAELALEAEGVTEEQEQKYEAEITALEAQIEKTAEELQPVQERFVASAKASAAKVPANVRDTYGSALVNLRAAVEAGLEANEAASLRYPVAAGSTLSGGLGGLKGELVEAAKANASDYVYEKTGSRMNVGTMSVSLTLDGGDVALTLDGLPVDQVGKIEVDDLVSETVSRTQAFAGKAFTFSSDADNTQRVLEYQASLLDAIIEGFESSGWKSPRAARVSEPGMKMRASANLHASAGTKPAATEPEKKKSFFGL